MVKAKKLLVTGAHGFVAGSVIAQASEHWAVHALSRGEDLLERAGLHWHRLDPSEPDRLKEIFSRVRPDFVIHTAALADIDFCEAHQDLARRVNVGLTQSLVDLCDEVGAKLVFCSTDTVFDGEQAPYREQDPPGPLNYYAHTKVEAEKIVARLSEKFVVARLGLVVGLPILGAGNSFLARMMAQLKQGREVKVPANKVRTPIDVITLGGALLELAEKNLSGIFHLAGNDALNRFDMTRRIAARFGFSERLIVAMPPDAEAGSAPRPRDVSLDNSKARTHLGTPMRGFDEALDLIVRTAEHPAS